jgi:Ca2+-binding RTX toxin-like protein
VFYASVNAVTISGGSGIDTVDYSKQSNLLATDIGVTADLSRTPSLPLKSVAGQGWASGDAFDNIENLVGTQGKDTLYGDAGANLILGGDGDDTVQGRAGNDTLDGGLGQNTLSYADRAAGAGVTVDLSSTADANGITVSIGSGANQETDKIKNFSNVVGGAGKDLLTGDALANRLEGGQGDDTLIGGAGGDTLVGGADTLTGGVDTASYASSGSAVQVDLSGAVANAGGDAAGDELVFISHLIGSGLADTLRGNKENNLLDGGLGVFGDTLYGGAGNDTLLGGEGHDLLIGGLGADSLDGGVGTMDVASYVDALTGVTVDMTLLDLGAADASNEGAGDVLKDIEKVIGSSKADIFYAKAAGSVVHFDGGSDAEGVTDSLTNTVSFLRNTNHTGVAVALAGDTTYTFTNIDNLTGTTGNDTLVGSDSTNVIDGGAGNDTLKVSLGKDTLDGGTGTDFVDFSSLGASIAVTLPGDGGEITSDVNVGGLTHQLTLKNIEGLKATHFDDSVTGSAGDDEIHGLDGNDALTGAGGDDTLLGGGRADTLDGGAGRDFASYAEATTGLVIDLVGSTDTDEAIGDVFSNIEGVIGSGGNDTIIGGHASIRTLKGEAGNDTFKALDLSTDTISGGEGSDTIDMAGSSGTAITLTSAKYSSVEVVTGTASNETMDASAWAAAITLDGGAGNDTLTGGSASDVLRGGAGNDSLTGGLGDDKLHAGTGQDNLSGGQGADELFGRDSTGQFSGGDGNDVIHADHVAMANSTVDGGAGTDTLFLYMSSSAGLVMNAAFLPNANFQNIEILDLSKDDYASDLTLTKEGIAHLVDTNVAGVDLTIQLEAGKDKLGGLTFTAGSATTWTDTATDWSAKVEWV